jgi:hypothetical protein
VDLEQREGRVHRFKGHAVRKNIATRCGNGAMEVPADSRGDIWKHLFEEASRGRPAGENDLVPYWVYSLEGGARIERHVPALPLSRDAHRADQLRRSLTVYRMAFGQSRQEDLVNYLLGKVDAAQLESLSAQLCVDLAPPKHPSPMSVPAEWEEVADHRVDAVLPTVSTSSVSLTGLASLLDEFNKVRPTPPPAVTEAMLDRLLTAFLAAGGES